jgi:predicted transcriptional regulator
MDVPKTVGLHEGWHDVRAGATPPFDARCVTVAVGSLPPSNELRVSVLCGRIERHEDLSDKRSDTLYENERRSPLSILKSPPKQPKAVTIQARVEESVKTQLELYAEFIDASPSYVITEALKLLFRKDEDFRDWVGQHSNNHNNEKAKGDVLAKAV